MIQSIYYYNPYLKPSQYLLYVTSNGELYSWYMFVLLSQPRSNQPSNHSAYSFAVTQPHAPISRQYILTAMETENSAECAEDRKDEHDLTTRTYTHPLAITRRAHISRHFGECANAHKKQIYI